VIDLAICGIRGRMGSAVERLAHERADVRVIGGVGRGPVADHGVTVASMEDAASLIAGASVVVDFSTAAATRALLGHYDALRGRALVIGTTGLDAGLQQQLDETARHTAVLTAANFSIGVNLLLGLCERVAAALPADRYDAEITEAHHSAKIDAPSGTALALGEAIARGRGQALAAARRDGRSGDTGPRAAGEIGIHAVRGGGVIGEHTVMFLGQRERVELRHEATDRLLFAEGALAAAVWLAGREPGRYTMRDVLNLQL
jgi:4-hydroxy-tetrahydrodipicolinate reductase